MCSISREQWRPNRLTAKVSNFLLNEPYTRAERQWSQDFLHARVDPDTSTVLKQANGTRYSRKANDAKQLADDMPAAFGGGRNNAASLKTMVG